MAATSFDRSVVPACRPPSPFAMPFTKEQREKFSKVYEKSIKMEDAKIVQSCTTMLQILKEAAMSQEKRLSVKSVVPHDENRGGALMKAQDVYRKLSKILSVGVSLDKCDPCRAIAFGRNPKNDRMSSKWLKHSTDNPHFATFDDTTIEAGSVGCGHLNQGLACIFDECLIPSSCTEIGEGRLDRHALCKNDPVLQDVLANGLTWTLIHYSIQDEFPKLPGMLQRALNVEHHIGEGETWDEQLLGIAQSIVGQCNDRKSTPDYRAVIRLAMMSKPPRIEDIPMQVDFCKKWGGGASQSLILDICRYIKMKPKAKIVSQSSLTAMNGLQFSVDDLIPEFIASMMKCIATRGQSRNGVSVHIEANEIKSLSKNRLSSAKVANEHIKRAMRLSKELGDEASIEWMGDMACDLVDFVMEKGEWGKDNKKKGMVTTMDAIIEGFVAKVSGQSSKQEAGTISTGDTNDGCVGDAPMFDATGEVARQSMENLGWKVGTLLNKKVKADLKIPRCDLQWEIGVINDDGSVGVHNVQSDGKTNKDTIEIIPAIEITKHYRIIDNKFRLSKDKYPLMETDINIGMYAAAATMALQSAMHTQSRVPTGAMYLQKTPTAKLIVQADSLVVGDLVCVAWGPSARVIKRDVDNEIVVKLTIGETEKLYNIEPPDVKQCAVEFWRMRRVAEKENANMEITMLEVTVPLPAKWGVKSIIAKIPAAILTKKVVKGDELVLFVNTKAAKPVEKRALAMVIESRKSAKTDS